MVHRERGWRRDASRELERELAANTFASGVNRELATDYHRFVTELGLVALVEAEAAGPEGPAALLAQSLDVAAALLDVAGHPPRRETETRAGRSSSMTPTRIRGRSCWPAVRPPSEPAAGGPRSRGV